MADRGKDVADPGRALRVILGFLLLGLAACAPPGRDDATAPSGSASAGADPVSGDGAEGGDLVVEVDRGNGSPPERYTLTCAGTASGDHPAAVAACEHLQRLDAPFAPLPGDVVCTEVYGGPQTARVTGVWHGEPVDLRLSRVDGCRIAQWDLLGPLLPGPVGVDPPARVSDG